MELTHLIATDNEGCLTDGKYLPINLDRIAAIRAFLVAHPTVGFLISTGRPVPYVEAMIQMVGIPDSTAPCICEGGGALYTPATDRTELLAPPVEVEPLRAALAGSGFREEPGKLTCYSVYPEAPDTVESLHQKVLASGIDARYHVTVSAAAVDVTPKGVDKGSALRLVADRLGISMDRVLAFGDSANDVPMMVVAGVAAAPSNASEAARRAAKFVSEAPAAAGLLDALQRFVRGELG